jgi:hypothetical protein
MFKEKKVVALRGIYKNYHYYELRNYHRSSICSGSNIFTYQEKIFGSWSMVGNRSGSVSFDQFHNGSY